MPADDPVSLFLASSTTYYVKPPPAYLDCSICQNTLHDPVVCSTGLHTFCRTCLSDWVQRSTPSTCPIDRAPLTKTVQSAPRLVFDMLEELDVVCSLGCGWSGKSGDLTQHLRSQCSEAARAKSQFLASLSEPRQSGGDLWAICDACNTKIYNRRHKCCTCKHFDLCGTCWDKGVRSSHNKAHSFVLIKDKKDYFKGEVVMLQEHPGIVCDSCLRDPMQGIRYKCQTCDIDFCESCLLGAEGDLMITRKQIAHDPSHAYIRVVYPERAATTATAPPRDPSAATLSTGYAVVQGETDVAVHTYVRCDGCTVAPIRGVRWKCQSCPHQYDLCGDCFSHWRNGLPSGMHSPGHQMRPILVPEN